jgi:biotin transport system substrate-specific component
MMPAESVGAVTGAAAVAPARKALHRVIAVVCGAALVAVAAQFAIPVGPVPVSLEGGAVLLVGGLLGRRYGAAALATFLAAGAAGLPVFANGGFGVAHLVGPTGGYLIAFPAAAALAGWLAAPRAIVRSTLAALAGMALIHLGGLAWLTVTLGSWSRAFAVGTAPFLVSDLLSVLLVGGLIAGLGGRTRRLV